MKSPEYFRAFVFRKRLQNRGDKFVLKSKNGYTYGEVLMRKGFTILELMVVMIILGIVAAMAIPSLGISLERSRIKNAEFNLMAIYNAEKRYKLYNETNSYYTTPQSSTDQSSVINAKLGLKLTEPYFDYWITDTSTASTTEFTAVARRKGTGYCGGKTMSLTSANTTIKKGCKIWE